MNDDQEQERESEDQQYVTIHEAAGLLKVSTKKLREWTKENLIEAIKPSGRKFGRVRISIQSLKAFIEKHTTGKREQDDVE